MKITLFLLKIFVIFHIAVSGAFSALIDKTIDGVVGISVVVEACLDFSDEESVSVFDEQKALVRRGIVESLGVVGSLLDASRVGSKMREGLGVVILGPPNCGKSTLLNALAKEALKPDPAPTIKTAFCVIILKVI